MYLMKGQQLESFLQAQDNAVSLANTWDTSIMPYQFWTKRTARGENRGRGLQAGSDYFVFKSYEDKYLSRNDGGHMKHKDQTNSQIKFQYRRVQSSNDGQVGIRAYNNKYMRCDGKKLYCDRDNLSHDEIFYIYQTSDCTGTGVPEGDACVALKALNGEQGSWVFPSDDNWVWCDGESADYKAKWSGWNTEGWTVDSMVYDFDAATESPPQPISLTNITVDARYSSTPDTERFVYEYSETTTSSWERSTGVDFTVGQEFTVSVPIFGGFESTSSFSTTTSVSHTWGEVNEESETITVDSSCSAAAGFMENCEVVATREEVDVPYTMTLSKPGGFTMTQTGIWHGVATFNVHKVSTVIALDRKSVV